jgi:hypothetical protein
MLRPAGSRQGHSRQPQTPSPRSRPGPRRLAPHQPPGPAAAVTLPLPSKVARAASILVFFPLLSTGRVGYAMTWRTALVMTWAGLRGAVGVAMSLFVVLDPLIESTEFKVRRLVVFGPGDCGPTLGGCFKAGRLQAAQPALPAPSGLRHPPPPLLAAAPPLPPIPARPTVCSTWRSWLSPR